ncbi:MAG: hypothetical protein IKW19_08530, partial [Akkermansia sp.]|nr:hypothetical protein [Akkermansia sp.]
MKLHLPKLLRKAVIACMTAAVSIGTTVGTGVIATGALSVAFSSTSAYAATTAYTSSSAGIATGNASMKLDKDNTAVNNTFDLSAYSGTLELSGNGEGSISTVSTNGGYGGRVQFAATTPTEGLTVLLNDGIEANLGNIDTSSVKIKADNASIFGDQGDWYVSLHIGEGGLR